MTLHANIIVDLVKVFFSNGNNVYNGRKSDKRFKTNIGSTECEVNTNLIHNMFGIPEGGEGYSTWTLNYAVPCRLVFEDNSIMEFISDTTRMSLHNRLLRIICTQVLVPRSGNFSQITKEDLWLMQCI